MHNGEELTPEEWEEIPKKDRERNSQKIDKNK